MTLNLETARRLLIAAVALGATQASRASAQEDHTISGTCVILPEFYDPDPDGFIFIEASCPFSTPGGDQTLHFMVHMNNDDSHVGHVAAQLDQTWRNIWLRGDLESFNPQVNFHLGCAPAGDDGSNATDFPTGNQSLAEGYMKDEGRWTPDFSCPDDRPQLRAVYVDTTATW